MQGTACEDVGTCQNKHVPIRGASRGSHSELHTVHTRSFIHCSQPTSLGRLSAENAAQMLRWVLLRFWTEPPIASSRASAFCRCCRLGRGGANMGEGEAQKK